MHIFTKVVVKFTFVKYCGETKIKANCNSYKVLINTCISESFSTVDENIMQARVVKKLVDF